MSQVKGGARRLFGGDFSYHAKLVGGIERVRTILIEAGTDGIKHSDLARRVFRKLDAAELKMLTNIMHECGMIQIFNVKRGQFYRATRSIEKLNVTSEILSKLNLSS